MSIICIDLDYSHFTVYMKGSPEKILQFCDETSLPQNYLKEIKEYQSKGYRVLAYATRALEKEIASSLAQVMNLERDEVEKRGTFQFIGIVVMDN